MNTRVRQLQGGILIDQRAGWALGLFSLIVLGNALAFLVFTLQSVMLRQWGSATTGAVFAALSLGVLYRVYRKREVRPATSIWIPDHADDRSKAPIADVQTIAPSQISRICLRYCEDPKEARNGRFHALLELRDSKATHLLQSSAPLSLASAIKRLDGLAQRWNTILECESKSVVAARQAYTARGGIIVLLLSILPLAFGGWIAYRQLQMAGWPASEATIGKFEPGIGGGGGVHWYANPSIEYRYQVGVNQFTGTRLNPSPFNYQSESRFLRDTAQMKVGAVIRCWYDPRQPSVAYVVNTGVTTDALLLVILGVLGIALYVFLKWKMSESLAALNNRFGFGVSPYGDPAKLRDEGARRL